jgi:hypothetical protein
VTVWWYERLLMSVGVPDAGGVWLNGDSELWRFTTSTLGWERVESSTTAVNEARPSARSGHTMTSVGVDLWVHGGNKSPGNGVEHSSELWRFTTSTRGWERVNTTAANETLPSARSGHTMTSVGLDLWVHGGTTQAGGLLPADDLWRFTTSTRGWGRVDSSAANEAHPSARTGHTMTSVGLDLWVHGGGTSLGLDLASNTPIISGEGDT